MTSHSVTRFTGSALVAGLVMAAAVVPQATAQPPMAGPATVSEAMKRMTDLATESARLNEQQLNAAAEVDKRRGLVREAEAKQQADGRLVAEAQARVHQYQPVVDKVAAANYKGARTSRVFAILTSDSPQQLLDQMSAIDVIAAETVAKVDALKRATADAAAAEDASRASADAAKAAVEQAKQVTADLDRKQHELQAAIAEVLAAWAGLSGAEKSILQGSPFPPGFDPALILKNLVPGSGTSALQAGLTKIGMPYVWGGTGPSGFDCSGLVQWAFKQVGKNLPRTSFQQAAGGSPVAANELRPGDVVIFYPDQHHVGIYAGNGMVLHASTFGIPVRVEPMASMPFNSARRY